MRKLLPALFAALLFLLPTRAVEAQVYAAVEQPTPHRFVAAPGFSGSSAYARYDFLPSVDSRFKPFFSGRLIKSGNDVTGLIDARLVTRLYDNGPFRLTVMPYVRGTSNEQGNGQHVSLGANLTAEAGPIQLNGTSGSLLSDTRGGTLSVGPHIGPVAILGGRTLTPGDDDFFAAWRIWLTKTPTWVQGRVTSEGHVTVSLFTHSTALF